MQDHKTFGPGEEAFRLIVETIPGLIAVMTPSGEVEHVNRQVFEYFGRTLEELKRWGTTDAVHPDDLPRVITAWQQPSKRASRTNSSIASGEPMASTAGSNYAGCRFVTSGAGLFGGTSS